MTSDRYRSGYRSSHAMDDFTHSRPHSHGTAPPSDAFAFGMAIEAMRTAAEAMSRAAEATGSRSSSFIAPQSQPLSSQNSHLSPNHAGLRPFTPPEIPQRGSSLDQSRPQRPPLAHLQSNSSFNAALQSPFAFPERSGARPRLGGGGGGSHMDLVDAASYLSPHPSFGEKGHPYAYPYPRYSGTSLSYGEDVADRNMGGFGPPSRSSSMPLARESSKMSTSIHDEAINAEDDGHGHGHGHTMSLGREIVFIFLICMAQLLTQCALAQTIAPLPYIAKSLDAISNASSLAWYSAAFALTAGTFILPAGRFGDVYGHKILFIIGWIWFSLSSLLCGFAPMVQDSPAGMDGGIFFITARAIQGIGPALVMPNGLALMGTTYPPGKKKNMLFALFGACAPAGFVVGATFSSLLAQKAQWEFGFWVMAGVCAIFGVGTAVFIPSPSRTQSKEGKRKHRTFRAWIGETSSTLDLPGAFLGVTALLLINIALNQAPLVGWETPYTYFILLLGFLMIPFFFYQQLHAPSPLIPRSILNKATSFVLVCTACGWSSMGIWIFYIWSYMETLHHISPLHASAWFAPAPVAGCVASLVTGWGLSQGKPQWVMLASMIAFCVGTALISTSEPKNVYWVGVFFSIVIMPFGMDMSFPSATLLVSDRAGRGSQGMAASAVNTVVNYSISIGLGLAGTVVRGIGADKIDAAEIREEELLRGFRSAWWTGVGLSGVGIIVAAAFCVVCWVESRRKTRQEAREAVK